MFFFNLSIFQASIMEKFAKRSSIYERTTTKTDHLYSVTVDFLTRANTYKQINKRAKKNNQAKESPMTQLNEVYNETNMIPSRFNTKKYIVGDEKYSLSLWTLVSRRYNVCFTCFNQIILLVSPLNEPGGWWTIGVLAIW